MEFATGYAQEIELILSAALSVIILTFVIMFFKTFFRNLINHAKEYRNTFEIIVLIPGVAGKALCKAKEV